MPFTSTTLATISAISSVVGLGMSVMGNMQAASAAKANAAAQKQALDYQAQQAQINAGQERAAAQRRSIAQKRKTDIVLSNLQTRAAASGAGALDPGVIDLTGDIAQEGEYRSLSALYEGEERARGLETQAALRQFEGNAAMAAGERMAGMYRTRAVSTALTGAASLYDKYGGGGPSSSNDFKPMTGFDNYGLTKTGDFYG